ncbi:DNA mismatch repair endonuclease MutL [Thermodesulfovibrionales bacterium]|nr:DNA mismatch repair endonuclease MutL [Thermodesulfovibrionales bacterium]
MPQINILPLDLRNKIAAGEVVDRPSSVVKELIENSLDARSTRIEVNILRSGKRLINVSDNGVGMDREDVLLAFERHATSKIKDEDDLFNIKTLGFRGEALSCISAVSKVRLITSSLGNAGTCLEIVGGDIKGIKDCSAVGTTIEVKDLFFNTPARRKFLRSDRTENYHIIDTTTKEAISNYRIGFFLKMDGDDVLSLPAASSHRERLLQVFGSDFVSELIEVKTEDNQMSIKAFIGKGTNAKSRRSNQFIFINKRPIKDHSISYAIYRGYGGLIPKERHPVFFIFIEMNPDKIDFNVHPTKREVRFADKNSILNFVCQTVETALNDQRGEGKSLEAIASSDGMKNKYTLSEFCSQDAKSFQVAETSLLCFSNYPEDIPFIYIGDTFVAIPDKNGVSIIDYHAAHERVNYERILNRTNMHSWFLLFPQQVRLQGSGYRIILENLQLLDDLGLEVDDFGHETIIVRRLPEFLKGADLDILLRDIAASLLDGNREGRWRPAACETRYSMIEPLDFERKAVAARLACHSSVRGREIPDGARIVNLLKDLDATDNPAYCPHGRPTRILISAGELRKMFKK